jgi:uncharacterized repeat protein (TIGR01451 family)
MPRTQNPVPRVSTSLLATLCLVAFVLVSAPSTASGRVEANSLHRTQPTKVVRATASAPRGRAVAHGRHRGSHGSWHRHGWRPWSWNAEDGSLVVTLSENSPEHELLRGVHTHPTVFTVKVRNDAASAANAVWVADFIPAGIEFLGCGGVDNGGVREYDGAASLEETPLVGDGCLEPQSVSTVVDPIGYPAGVYTLVEWAVGDIDAGATTTIQYAAGIPQRENTLVTAPARTAAQGLDETANLVNNVGASTRETDAERWLTSYVRAEAHLAGRWPHGWLKHEADSAGYGVSAEDLAVQKTVTPTHFAQGGVATYAFTIEAGEYADASDVLLVDHLPDGMCPLSDDANYAADSPADCAPDPAYAPTGATIDNVVQNADGSFDIAFDPIDVQHDGSVTVSFKARMRHVYAGDGRVGEPTSSGDAFTNSVSATATTAPAPGVEPPPPDGAIEVGDESQVTITSDEPTTDARVKPNVVPMDCDSGPYVDDPTRARSAFSEGSRVCLRLRVDFPSTASTRRPTVAGLLPDGMTFEPGSAVLTSRNDVTAVLDDTQSDPVWRIGDVTDVGRFAQPGGVFEARFAAIVSTPAPGPQPAGAHAVARLRYLDGDDLTQSQRDDVDLLRTAPPPLSILKGVADVEDIPDPDNPPDTDGVLVQGGDVVTYRIDLSNAGSEADLNAIDVTSPEVWDVLPAGVACSDVVVIARAGVCTGPGDAGHPTFEGDDSRSAIVWRLPAGYTIVAGDRRRLGYDVMIPSSVGPSALLTNTAAVRSYDTLTNTGSTAEHLPADNIDTSTDPGAWDAPAARDASSVATAGAALVTVDKSADSASLAVGERGGWAVSVGVPGGAAFYDAAVLDRLPLGLDAGSVQTVSVSCTYADSSPCAVPGGGADLAAADGPGDETRVGWLLGDLGADPAPRTITVAYTAAVADVATAVAGVVLTNHAQLAWDDADGADPASAGATFDESSVEASADVTVTEPALSIAKSASVEQPAPGDVFDYTVGVSNAADPNTSSAFDVTVVDDVPDGVVVRPASVSDGGVLEGAGLDGGGTITWTIPGPIAAAAARALTYSATLAASEDIGSGPMTNSATIASYRSRPGGGRSYAGPQSSATVSPVFPHVSIDKAVGDPLAYIGQSTPWTLTVTSDGDTEAFGADVRDALPPNWAYVADSATVSVGGGPATPVEPSVDADQFGRQALAWTDFADLPAGQTAVIAYSATPGASVVSAPGVGSSTPHVNTATVAGSDATGAERNADGPYHGPDALASAHVDSADVTIDITHDGSAVAGTSLTWELAVANQGDDDAIGPFTVTDDLPAGVGAAIAAGDGWSCSVAASSVSCVRSTAADALAPGESFPTIAVTAPIPADAPAGAGLTNTARVAARTYDPVTANNEASDTVTSTSAADLSLAKELIGDLVAGQPGTYSLTVSNAGPSDAAGPLVVTDTVPDGTSFVAADGDGWSCDEAAGEITCTRADDLAVGASAPTIAIVLQVHAARQAAVLNSASVSAQTPDPDVDDNADSVISSPSQAADLALEKESVGPFVAGGAGVYRLTVHNFGPSWAGPGIQVTDALPAELAYTGFTEVSGDWACSADGQDVTCELDGRLPDGDDAVVEIAVAIDSDHLGDIHNEAAVSAPTADPDETDNVDADDTANNVRSDLAVEKSHDGVATAGADLSYTIAVRNDGPSGSAGPITVTDVLPAGMSYVSADGVGWDCTAIDQTVTCVRQTRLRTGTEAPDITVVAAIEPDAGPATLVNAVTVDGPETDPDLSNNVADDPTQVVDSADVAVTKSTVGDDPVVAGTTTAFRIDVRNDGPSDADAISVSDALPAGMSALTVDGPGWDCSTAAPITCTRDSLAAGASAPPIDVAVAVGAAVGDGTTLVNEATVSTSTAGDDPADDADSASVGVVASADLSLTKTHENATVTAGTSMTFDVAVANAGPSDDAGPIAVTDQLPAGMTYAANTGPWTCAADDATPAGQQVTCTLDSSGLPAGVAASTLGLIVQVASGVDDGVLTNTARVEGGAGDPTPANDADADDVEVVTSADVSVVKSHVGDGLIGQTLDFTLAVANAGPSDARDAEVTDSLPAGLAFVSGGGAGWSCSAVGTTVTCDRTGALAPGSPAEQITVRVSVGAAAYPSVDNTATVSASTPDPNAVNDASTDSVTVPALADLAVVKTHPLALRVGRNVGYRIRITNLGPLPSAGPLVITDVLPDGLTYVAGDSFDWTCSHVGQTVTCVDADGMAVGVETTIVLIAAVGPAAFPAVTNTASLTSPTRDSNLANNSSSDPAAVLPPA